MQKWESGGPLTIKDKVSYTPMQRKCQNKSICFYMPLSNFAEPKWLCIPCDKKMNVAIICIKDKKTKLSIHSSRASLIKRYFCASNAILVNGGCYEFHWTSQINSTRYVREISKLNIMSFKHIYEAIALENTILSAFILKNISTMIDMAFVRYFHTVNYQQSFVSISDKARIHYLPFYEVSCAYRQSHFQMFQWE